VEAKLHARKTKNPKMFDAWQLAYEAVEASCSLVCFLPQELSMAFCLKL
jgi:hypothetical protein